MSKHLYIERVMEAVASKATCPKSSVGAVFVTMDFEIVATGYNGAPKGFGHCSDVGCNQDAAGKCTNTVHAETNAVLQAAKRGSRLEGTILFVSRWPCKRCAMMLANLSLVAVVVPYYGRRNPEGEAVLKKALVECLEICTDGTMRPSII
jgi:dCMP deaminase